MNQTVTAASGSTVRMMDDLGTFINDTVDKLQYVAKHIDDGMDIESILIDAEFNSILRDDIRTHM